MTFNIFLGALVFAGALGSVVSLFLQIALYRRMRNWHPEQWSSFPRSDVHPVVGNRVRRFVRGGYYRSVPDSVVQRLGSAILWLQRALELAVVVGVVSVLWRLYRHAA